LIFIRLTSRFEDSTSVTNTHLWALFEYWFVFIFMLVLYWFWCSIFSHCSRQV